MRAAVERCAELEVLADGRSEALDVAIGKINKAEAELAKVTAERDRVTVVRDEEKAELDALTEWTKRLEGKFQLACSQRNDAGTEAHELRVQLAKVTAERDQARHSAEVYRDAWAEVLDDDDPSDKNYLAWERATPTEGA
jgi:chromosome segregation ATPase